MVRAQFQELRVDDKVAGRDRTSPSGLVKATLPDGERLNWEVGAEVSGTRWVSAIKLHS